MNDEEHRAWRRQRARDGQRYRRGNLRRIDYQDVSSEAATVIDGLAGPFAGGDFSSILNRIVVEWAAYRNKVPRSRPRISELR